MVAREEFTYVNEKAERVLSTELAQRAIKNLVTPNDKLDFMVKATSVAQSGQLTFVIDHKLPLNEVLIDFVQFLYALDIPNFHPARSYDVQIGQEFELRAGYDCITHLREIEKEYEDWYKRNDETSVVNYSDPTQRFFFTGSYGPRIKIGALTPQIGPHPSARITQAYEVFLLQRQQMLSTKTK